jgi:glutamate-1-semialdehyde 2,1-aminomutase
MDQSLSRELLARAAKVIPGGVNSPVRAFASAHCDTPFITKGKGAYMYDEDGNRFVDYICSWGPLILGHAHPEVLEALRQTAERGTSFGAPTALEVELAERICALLPSIEMVRLVNSGTEATMSAVRLARGVTHRDKFLKFVGCYHGHGDSFLISAGSGLATFGTPSSPGVPKGAAQDTLTCAYNDLEEAQEIFAKSEDEIAAIIVEPVAGNMGCVLPEPGFLEGLRSLCDQSGALLIFDEVMTGFRVGPACAQGYFKVEPDLTTLGKVIGGGLPVGAYGGKREYMEAVSPRGPIYQAGTLSGNPLAVSAGLKTLEVLYRDPKNFAKLSAMTEKLTTGLRERAAQHGVQIQTPHVGSMAGMYFSASPVRNFADAQAAAGDRFYRFHAAMLEHGVYLAPSPYEAWFLSLAHGEAEIAKTLDVAEKSFALLAEPIDS